MAEISVLSGIVTDGRASFRRSYPLNLEPVPMQQGISNAYLRTSPGMAEFGVPVFGGADRGGINWAGKCYRVMGENLVLVKESGEIESLGTVQNDGKRVTMVNGFDRLAIASAGKLFYWSESRGLETVNDSDLGRVDDVIWAAGYYIVTDGSYLIQTELADPLSINPLKYGSSEASPDEINSLLYVRNEVIAINRYTCEYFANVGGTGFAWRRVEGAMIPKGSIGTHASCYYLDSFAFVGGAYNEGLSVYVGSQGQALKIATAEIETILSQYTETQLADLVLETRSQNMHAFLYIHLPDQTIVYDAAASKALEIPAWHILKSGESAELPYRARNFVQCYGKWLFGDNQASRIGYLVEDDARQFGQTVPWQFDTAFIYNEGRGAIFHELELVRLPGRYSPDSTKDATVFCSYTDDGLSWSNPRPSLRTRPGMYSARTVWRRLGAMRHWRGVRLRGMNNPAPDAFARLEARLEPLGA